MNIDDTIKQLRIARRMRELSQEKVAERIGVSPGAFSFYENYRTRPTLETMTAWAEVFDYEIVMMPKKKP